ncbi:MAG: CHRD domain-containing protein [Rhodospirillaceae bacterium]
MLKQFSPFLPLLIISQVCGLGSAFGQAPPNQDFFECGYYSPDENDISGPPISFYAELSADEQSAVTESPGVGRVDLVLDRSTLRLNWEVSYSNITSSAIGLHIHGPQTPGGEAGIIIDLAPGEMMNPIKGSEVLTEGTMIYLVQDRLYINLHTTNYPAGELRGHIKKVRKQC